MLEIAFLLAVEAGLLVAILVLREPKLLILCVIVGLPVEYFATQTLGGLGQGGVGGAIRALLNPGKLAMLATVCVVIIRERHTPWRLVPNSAVLLPVVVLLAISVIGLAWADSLVPSNAVAILPMYVAFVFTAPRLIEDRRDVERIVGTLLLVCTGLSLLAIAQRPFGIFNWRTILIAADGYTYRSNATFADPNDLARYMAICISLAAGLILATGPRRTTLYLAVPTLAVTAIGIILTASRSGWLLTIVCTAMVVFAAPIARATKVKLASVAVAGLVAIIALLLLQGGENAARVTSLASPLAALGQRDFLIRVGWQEFLDNPLVGVGTGNYQHALITTYRYLIPSWAVVTLSHTTIVTIMAEWGIMGLAMFAFISIRIATVVVHCFRANRDQPYLQLISAWLGAALFGIVLHSQSEGRLFDEPYLYLFLAMLVAVETSRKLAARREQAREDLVEAAPVLPGAPGPLPVPAPVAPLASALSDEAEAS